MFLESSIWIIKHQKMVGMHWACVLWSRYKVNNKQIHIYPSWCEYLSLGSFYLKDLLNIKSFKESRTSCYKYRELKESG